ncbi:MAG: hypothetical protein J6K44_02825, partial [Clostridia bacterium]|nr:hypothetical protein [Clostridia bacterium]
MAEENMNIPEEQLAETSAPAEKKAKSKTPKKENFFVRVWKKLVKFCKDTAGELSTCSPCRSQSRGHCTRMHWSRPDSRLFPSPDGH